MVEGGGESGPSKSEKERLIDEARDAVEAAKRHFTDPAKFAAAVEKLEAVGFDKAIVYRCFGYDDHLKRWLDGTVPLPKNDTQRKTAVEALERLFELHESSGT